MAQKLLPANLPEILRDAGLKVVVVDGWRNRYRPNGSFGPVGVLVHHTATKPTSEDRDVVNLLVRGRSDLPGPLCQLGLGRDGTVYVIAAGRGNHAGKAKANGTVAAGDGNSLYIGIEAFNDGVGEPWPDVQYDAYVKLCAVLCKRVTGNSAQTVRGHKETSVTGKIDPTFDMNEFRAKVAAEMASNNSDGNVPSKPTRGANVDEMLVHATKAMNLLPKATNARASWRYQIIDKALRTAVYHLRKMPLIKP